MKRRDFITLLGGAAVRDGLRGDALDVLGLAVSNHVPADVHPVASEANNFFGPSLPGSIRT